METLIIYHNGECSKSKTALELLQDHGIPHVVRWYLADPLDKEEISALLKLLSISAFDIIRKNEPLYKTSFEGKELREDDWLQVLVEHPILLERPIAVKNGKAIVARPPEKILELVRE